MLYIGAGAVATGGFVSLGRALPTIVNAFKAGIKNFSTGRRQPPPRGSDASAEAAKSEPVPVPRTMQDLPFSVVVYGSIGLVALMWLTPMLQIKLVPAILIMLFGFFFVVVSSRITGEIGSSSNPISGMTVATLLLTCLLFLAMGWVGVDYRAMALTTAAIVCIAASNGGTTSQDLKTGFLVGATPRRQQIALLVGVVSQRAGHRLHAALLQQGVHDRRRRERTSTRCPRAAMTQQHMKGPDGADYRVGFMNESGKSIPQGKYLVDAHDEIAFVVDPGIAGRVPFTAEKVEGERSRARRRAEAGHAARAGSPDVRRPRGGPRRRRRRRAATSPRAGPGRSRTT